MERKDLMKKAIAGFVTSAVFCAIAFCYWPNNVGWIITALFSGFIAGYISYDVKAFFQKIPVAWRQTKYILASAKTETMIGFQKLAAKEHPIFYLLLLSCTLSYWLFQFQSKTVGLFMWNFLAGSLLGAFFPSLLITFNNKCEHKFFFSDDENPWFPHKGKPICIEISYYNLLRSFFMGIIQLFIGVFAILSEIVRGMANCFLFFCRSSMIFVKQLIILTYNYERLSSSLLGLAGGIISAKFFAPQPFMSRPYVFGVFCGGLLGAGLVIVLNLAFSKLVAKWEAKKKPVGFDIFEDYCP